MRMRKHPGVVWTIGAFVGVLLFWAPVINGAAAGAFAGWFEERPSQAAGHALAASLAAIPLWWIASLYGPVLAPFAHMDGFWRAILAALAMLVGAVVVCAARTTRIATA